MTNKRDHWEQVYVTKQPQEVSWTQEVPTTSLNFIRDFQLSTSARIIDVGGGDSLLVDNLLSFGFQNLTVLDISSHAIERAKKRLGEDAKKVEWIVSDIRDFKPTMVYDCWHDRATFHFLTTTDEIDQYLSIARSAIKSFMVVSTFSESGPSKCSMLDVHRYSEEELVGALQDGFVKLRCIHEDHVTPFRTVQNFLYCSFKRNPHT